MRVLLTVNLAVSKFGRNTREAQTKLQQCQIFECFSRNCELYLRRFLVVSKVIDFAAHGEYLTKNIGLKRVLSFMTQTR